MLLTKKKPKFTREQGLEVARLCIEENVSLRYAIKLVMNRTGENWFQALERDCPDLWDGLTKIRKQRMIRKGFS